MSSKRISQISMEFLAITSILLFTLIPTIYIFSKNLSSMDNANKAGIFFQTRQTMEEEIRKVCYSGYPSRKSIKAYIPKNLKEIKVVEGNKIVYVVENPYGDEIYSSPMPCNLSISIKNSQGYQTIDIIHEGRYINITTR